MTAYGQQFSLLIFVAMREKLHIMHGSVVRFMDNVVIRKVIFKNKLYSWSAVGVIEGTELCDQILCVLCLNLFRNFYF
jgi:hypothetical protein